MHNALRSITESVRHTPAGAVRAELITAMLSRCADAAEERDKLVTYLDAGFTAPDLTDEQFTRWEQALQRYQAICDALTDAQEALSAPAPTPRRRAS